MRYLALLGCCILGCSDGGGRNSSSDRGSRAKPPALRALQTAILASRTSGVAPLAVYFDAAAATVPCAGSTADPFLSIEYDWDFGDGSSDSGPLAGHVYETPGEYQVTVTARDHSNSTEATRTTLIQVSDPDAVFPGAATVCVSNTGIFTSAPAGATLLTTQNLGSLQLQLTAGRRLLLRRGETWSTSSTLTLNVAGPGLIDAFGPGAPPRIRLTGNQILFRLSGNPPRLEDWRISNLEVDGLGGSKSRAVRAGGTCHQVTLLGLAARNVHGGFTFSTSHLDLWRLPAVHVLYDQIAVVGCSVDRVIGGQGGYGSMLSGRRLLFLGNRYDNAEEAEHIVRAQLLEGAVFAHNELGRPADTKSVLKLHGPDITAGGVGAGRSTERVVLRRNTFRGGLAAWPVVIGPEDDHTDQRVRQVLLEGNHFRAGPAQQVGVLLAAREVLARNNLLDSTGARSATCFWVTRRGIEPPPAEITILHSTGYTADPDRFVFLQVSQPASGVVLRGSLGVAPNSPEARLLDGSAAEAYNVLNPSPAFWVDTPVDLFDFRLAAGSPAIDVAPPVAEVWDDLPGVGRSANPNTPDAPTFDAGAFEN